MSQSVKQDTFGWNLEQSYVRSLPERFYTVTDPQPVKDPHLLLLNDELAKELGLNPDAVTDEVVGVLSGNAFPKGALPFSQSYAGHQFGQFTMLGDGRAIMIGEQITPEGKRLDLQLKGSGRTDYSRGGDGRAALGPMLREYLISEALYAMKIPANRALSITLTGEPVFRQTVQPGAILTRVADSHLRVGTFQFAAQFGDDGDVKKLADYAILRHDPDLEEQPEKYHHFFQRVMDRQAKLMADWLHVGFIHGVMNTDNMSISGESIDFGPCAFLDDYDPATVFSSIDREGRYAYGNQPYIASWNLARLAETLISLIHDDQDEAVKLLQKDLEQFATLYQNYWLEGMRRKLGLKEAKDNDRSLFNDLLQWMEEHHADFTNTFRSLSNGKEPEGTDTALREWIAHWHQRLADEGASVDNAHAQMKQVNPVVIPRNHLVEEALQKAETDSDMTFFRDLLQAVRQPYDENELTKRFTTPPPPDFTDGYQTFCGT
ncbi:protein adenylyltransferase SelO [Salisediminibacterium beveridgei]|uniref:Protein nucleotidyltransferase YdiU n=1 Tax=Salisediminibacterium beveridgei TaxID=632773 RepID=A0A1D7QXT4_9BACI|nr:YdiU family protein [Salisediminibacterium beveridgei]AOM83810.1 Selenoprotein O-like protein [Salisediminibacterium beveridgei]